MNIEWDADKYTKDFSFVHQYGNGVTELIDCEKGSSLIDLGCGNGVLTKALQEKGFRVTGMDSSGELLETAKRNYPDISFIRADAADFLWRKPWMPYFPTRCFTGSTGKSRRICLPVSTKR